MANRASAAHLPNRPERVQGTMRHFRESWLRGDGNVLHRRPGNRRARSGSLGKRPIVFPICRLSRSCRACCWGSWVAAAQAECEATLAALPEARDRLRRINGLLEAVRAMPDLELEADDAVLPEMGRAARWRRWGICCVTWRWQATGPTATRDSDSLRLIVDTRISG